VILRIKRKINNKNTGGSGLSNTGMGDVYFGGGAAVALS
jgi:hypothetical protein